MTGMVNAREFEKLWTRERHRVERTGHKAEKFWKAWRLRELEKYRQIPVDASAKMGA